jgi:hypothetical protein
VESKVLFVTALFAAAALIAGWIAVRFPRLAPSSFVVSGVGAFATVEIVSYMPVASGSYPALYGSVFGVLLPMLTAMWLCVIWLLATFRDALGASR